MKEPLGERPETVQINTSMHLENQLLATKFFMPKASHPLIFRPRLNGLLDEGLKYPLTALINLLVDSAQHFVLILDDYHVITEQQIHISLSYLVEHLPLYLHVMLATRTEPPFPLSQLRAGRQMLEVRTDQLRCTAE